MNPSKPDLHLSIITINLNNKEGLRKTIESVVNQTYKGFEYIIIDGGSTDGSLELIKKYDSHLSYWISEPDKGIYNAMNKGILHAKGIYCQFLNSGDWLLNNTTIENIFHQGFDEDIISGNRISVYNDRIKPDKGCQKSKLTFKDVYTGCICHSSSFIKKALFNTYGLYDENFRLNSDYIFFLKSLGFGNSSFRYIDSEVCYFDMYGISKNNKYRDLQKKELIESQEKYIPSRIKADYDLFLSYDHTIKMLKKYKLSNFLYLILVRCVNFYNDYFGKK